MGRPLNYGRHLVERDDIEAVVRVLESDLITQGPVVERFEAAVADRVGAQHAVAVSSGTAALHIACLAAGAATGHHGLTSAITFSATANALLYCGSDAGLVDIDSKTLGMEAASLERALAKHPETDIILPVHIAGLAGDVKKLRELAGGRKIIEDASHALGAIYSSGEPVGCCADSDMAVFSFHPVKPITSGEGGMIVTNDEDVAAKLRLLRNHGIEKNANRFIDEEQAYPDTDSVAGWYQEQQLLGFNYRMSDIHAALGLSQLHKLDRFIARRREIVARYDEAFSKPAGIQPLQMSPQARANSALHLYIVTFDFAALHKNRTDLMRRLLERGVGSQVHYLPIYRHPFYRERLGDVAAEFENAESYYASCLSLPLFQDMTDDEVEHVILAVKETCDG